MAIVCALRILNYCLHRFPYPCPLPLSDKNILFRLLAATQSGCCILYIQLQLFSNF